MALTSFKELETSSSEPFQKSNCISKFTRHITASKTRITIFRKDHFQSPDFQSPKSNHNSMLDSLPLEWLHLEKNLFKAKPSIETRGGVFDPTRCRFSSSPFLLMIPLCSYHVSFAYHISHVSNGEYRRSMMRQPFPLDLSPAE